MNSPSGGKSVLPANVSTKSEVVKTDPNSCSVPASFYESSKSGSSFSQAFSAAPFESPNSGYGPHAKMYPPFFNSNDSVGYYSGPGAARDGSAMNFPPAPNNNYHSQTSMPPPANQDIDLRNFNSNLPNQKEMPLNKDPSRMAPGFAILPTPPNHPPPHLAEFATPPWNHDEDPARDPRKRGRGGVPPFAGSPPKRPFRGRYSQRGGFSSGPINRGAARNAHEWSDSGYSAQPRHDQDYRDFDPNSRGGYNGNLRGGLDVNPRGHFDGRRPGRSRGRGRNYWQPDHRHPMMEHPDMSYPGMDESTEEPKTIKEVMQNYGDGWIKATVGEELETSKDSPHKLEISTGSNQNEKDDTYSPTKPSIGIVASKSQDERFSSSSSSRRDAHDRIDHIDAVKRARDVASEFDAHLEDPIDNRQKRSFPSLSPDAKSTHKSNKSRPRLPSDEDGSVPIVMQSDSDALSSSESTPVKPNIGGDSPQIPGSGKSQTKQGAESSIKRNQAPPFQNRSAYTSLDNTAANAMKLQLGNVDTSSPEYAKWWFYHFGRGAAANVGSRNTGFNQAGSHNPSHVSMN